MTHKSTKPLKHRKGKKGGDDKKKVEKPEKPEKAQKAEKGLPLLRVIVRSAFLSSLCHGTEPAPAVVFLKRGQLLLKFSSGQEAADAVAKGVELCGTRMPTKISGHGAKKDTVSVQGSQVLKLVAEQLAKALKPHGVAEVRTSRRKELSVRPQSVEASAALLEKKEFESQGKPCCTIVVQGPRKPKTPKKPKKPSKEATDAEKESKPDSAKKPPKPKDAKPKDAKPKEGGKNTPKKEKGTDWKNVQKGSKRKGRWAKKNADKSSKP